MVRLQGQQTGLNSYCSKTYFKALEQLKSQEAFGKYIIILQNCTGIAANVLPATRDNMHQYSQATFPAKSQDILNVDALHFKLARSVSKIASFEFATLKYFKSTFMNSKNC